MKQLVQHLRTGDAQILDVPAPRPGPNDLIVRNRASVISSGTERMVVEFSRQGLLSKARSRPDLARQVMDRVKRDGLLGALTSARTQLDQPLAMGYSSAGEVIAVGNTITEFRVGDGVACAGGGFAVHAEAVRIPRTLAAHIPSNDGRSTRKTISFEEAAFAAVGSVALHGLRLASPQLSETVAVIGLGLIGLIAVQLARACGCRVIGIDPDSSRCQLALRLGCDRSASAPEEFEILTSEITQGIGADAVLVTAATESSQPLELAAHIARERASVISIGSTGMNLPRKLFYEKELSFRISRAYGPGRYDSEYEEQGHDYPLGYVRWTEGRNLQALLELLAQRKVEVEPLISHRFPISSAGQAYELISGRSRESSLAVVIEYPGEDEISSWLPMANLPSSEPKRESAVRVGLLGAGNFAKSTLLPVMKAVSGTDMVAVCAASGASAAHAARKNGFRFAATDAEHVIASPEINTIVIATRHHLHATQVIEALTAGKHVFCEKPLCLNEAELRDIIAAHRAANERCATLLMVGFNRRFAPLALKLKHFLKDVHEPLVMNYRVNAGFLPASHWVQDRETGGGRIVGESCHFIDLMTFLCGSKPVRVFATATPDTGRYRSDNLTMQLAFANGSAGVITYVANGDKSFAKERLEVFAQGKMAILDDFRLVELVSNGRRKKVRSGWRRDKGHLLEWNAMVEALLNGKSSPISFEEIVSITLATFRALDSLQSGKPEAVTLTLEEQA